MSLSVQQLTVGLFLFCFQSNAEIDIPNVFLRNTQPHSRLLFSGFY